MQRVAVGDMPASAGSKSQTVDMHNKGGRNAAAAGAVAKLLRSTTNIVVVF